MNYNIRLYFTDFNYYPGGMEMKGRNYQAGVGSYRYTINGQEVESDLNKNITTALYWEYDSRIGRRWNIDPKPNTSISYYNCFASNPLLFNDVKGDTIRIKVKSNILTYNPQNKCWINKDGSNYTGKLNNFAKNVINDLKLNQNNKEGNSIVTSLAKNKVIYFIKSGDPNLNGINNTNIYYNGAESIKQKILEGGNYYSALSYIVLGHEMKHKYDQALGIINYKWFGEGNDARGIDEYASMSYENVLRKANGFPLRIAYEQDDNGNLNGLMYDNAGKKLPPPDILSKQISNLPIIKAVLALFNIL